MLLLNRKIVHIAIITVLGLILYINTLHVPFYFDDFGSIVDVPFVKKLSNFIDINSLKGYRGRGGFASRNFGYFTFALNYRLHGLNVTGYHLTNIAFHLLSALLVYRLVNITFRTPYFIEGCDRSMTEARIRFTALLAALLFVVHPLQTQAVTYLVQRFASLATMLYLLSITCYIKARLNWNVPRKRIITSCAWLTAALASAALAFKTKEIAYTLPFMVILYELMFFCGNLKRKVIAIVVSLSAVAVYTVYFSSVFSGRSLGALIRYLDTATRLQTSISRWDYLATQCRVLVTYLRLVLFPFGQRLEYDYPLYNTFLNYEVLLSAMLLCALFGAAVYSLYLSRRRSGPHGVVASPLFRLVAFGIFWFFLTLTIESSIIPIVDVIFEHRMYLPSAGLFMAVAASVSLAGGKGALIAGWLRAPILGARERFPCRSCI